MRRSGQSGVVLFVLAGALAAVAVRPGASRHPSAAADLDVRRRQAAAAHEFNRHLAAELTAGRMRLADGVDRIIEANVDRPDYVPSLHASVGGRTERESVAISLVYRAERPLVNEPIELPALRAEFAALFGRAYTPPRGQ